MNFQTPYSDDQWSPQYVEMLMDHDGVYRAWWEVSRARLRRMVVGNPLERDGEPWWINEPGLTKRGV